MGTLAFGLSGWEPRTVLSRGGRGSDIDPQGIPPTAHGEQRWVCETGGGKESQDSGYLHFKGVTTEFAFL